MPLALTQEDFLVTACIQRMMEGNIFTLSLISVGYPISGLDRGGTPSKVWTRGYPIPGLDGGYPIPGLDQGVPHPRSGQRGYSIPGLDQGVPHPRSGWGGGYLILLMGGYPPSS